MNSFLLRKNLSSRLSSDQTKKPPAVVFLFGGTGEASATPPSAHSKRKCPAGAFFSHFAFAELIFAAQKSEFSSQLGPNKKTTCGGVFSWWNR